MMELDDLDRALLAEFVRNTRKELNSMAATQQDLSDALDKQGTLVGTLKTALEKVIADLEAIRSQPPTNFQALLDKVTATSTAAQTALDEATAEDNSVNPPPPPPPPAPPTTTDQGTPGGAATGSV